MTPPVSLIIDTMKPVPLEPDLLVEEPLPLMFVD